MTEKKNIIDDPELIGRIDALVARTTLSHKTIIKSALQDYLDWNEEFIKKIEQGVKDADDGNFASQSEIDRVLNKYKPT